MTEVLEKFVMFSLLSGLLGCAGSTDALPPASGFDLERYTGRWYEIARFDHSFERGLSNVTASYTPAGDHIAVLNRGYDNKASRWRTASGKARFPGASNIGLLEVSFFGPFYGDYKIIILDPDYQWSVVTSSSYKYLWILSRTPTIEKELLDTLRQRLISMGFSVDDLIFVSHDRQSPE